MKDWLNIAGKTVIVTGASSGIGQAIVKELLDLEVNVVNFDIANNDLEHEHYLF
ncbi:SDR family NAD(P)-dependent oxidoreductase, partial [Streptococcus sobrinus]